MNADCFGRPVYFMKLKGSRVVILVDTYYGSIPVLAFPTREDFAQFASAVQDFRNEIKPDVPDVFKEAFNNSENP